MIDHATFKSAGFYLEAVRLTQHITQKIKIMHVKIQHNGTTLFLIMEPILKSPFHISADTLHSNGFQLSEFFCVVSFLQIFIFLKGTYYLSYHNLLPGSFFCFKKHLAILFGQTYRFFHQYIHPFFQCLHCMFCMQIAWKTDMYNIQLLLFDQFHSVFICGSFRKI